jgi:hypothetical protein
MTTSETLLLRPDGISWTATNDGEVIVLDHFTAKYISANPSAAELWALLAQGATQSELEVSLVTKFGITPAAAREDVTDFIRDLRLRKLLKGPP